jgi:ABC-type transporter MlaC component
MNLGAYVMRRYFFFVLAAMFFVGLGHSKESNDPKSFVEKVVGEALNVVNSSNLPDETKRKNLSESVNKYLGVEWLAEKVFIPLGYKELSKKDQKRVQDYLKNYLLKFYAGEGKLSAMMGAKLLPIKDRDVDSDRVKTKFKKDGNSKSVEIVWVVQNGKVLYVEIESISQLITLRSEMKSAVGERDLMSFIKDSGF